MDPNNNHFNTQNSSNYPFSYQNPNNYQNRNQFSNQRPQNIPNFGFVGAPEFPEFSTQITLGGMIHANEVTPNPVGSTPNRKKNQQPT
ncbi:hypothetical protein MTR_7g009090 [Medicago truncatula]|uniref:Uncharacterized protein n=1 Tax=Medicago truncatula TaxID=3880 RepID=G7KYS4_MEDTR|nr:hypothetical protein MTR_7g009090 [Medicago truncatula]